MSKTKQAPSRAQLVVTIPITEDPVERRVRLVRHPANTMFNRRFNAGDIERWKQAAKNLDMSDTEFVECVMNAAADAVLK